MIFRISFFYIYIYLYISYNYKVNNNLHYFSRCNPVGKIAKKTVWRSVPCCQKCTPTGCFFDDFAHWESGGIANVLYYDKQSYFWYFWYPHTHCVLLYRDVMSIYMHKRINFRKGLGTWKMLNFEAGQNTFTTVLDWDGNKQMHF